MCIRDRYQRRVHGIMEKGKPSAHTPAEVLKFTGPTKEFLCPVTANTYGISFGRFVIRNVKSGQTLLDIEPAEGDIPEPVEDDESRTIRYSFPKDMLKIPQIGTSVEFKVGSQVVKNFRMIERHYFRDQLLRSFDFNFGFCIPNSKNTWEIIYSIPEIKDSLLEEIVKHPFETKSDSFYFVGDEMIMHHKAEYEYTPQFQTFSLDK
eukprot:TRINITY_DN1547_c0_g1_i5.p1 TRINITY_DN1547_c0_g1~~TRINITY_DN1547_c0_g1_i5.p1  ORF type:complete len:206 (+),score=31.86 TRINITY_DN1547_c0_g1_i5:169-786(+)